MATEVRNSRILKARKAHRCHGCELVIVKGSPCRVSVNVDGGSMYSIYYCKECQEWLDKNWKKVEWPLYQGDIKEYRSYE